MKRDIHYRAERCEYARQRVLTDPALPEQSRKDIIEFVQARTKEKHLRKGRVEKYWSKLLILGRMSKKPFRDWDETEVTTVFDQLRARQFRGKKLTEATIVDYGLLLKPLFRWMRNTKTTPPGVDWLANKYDDKTKICQVLNEDDAIQLINCASTVQDKALLAVLWELGPRATEILSLRQRDFRGYARN